MRKRHIVDPTEAIGFNMWRSQLVGKPLSGDKMRNILGDAMEYPKDRHFLLSMNKEPNPPIIRMGDTRNAVYVVSPKPVHITRLQTVWDDYTGSLKKEAPNKEELAHQKWAKQHPEFCIKVLKEQGLKVLKPGIQVELGYTEV